MAEVFVRARLFAQVFFVLFIITKAQLVADLRLVKERLERYPYKTLGGREWNFVLNMQTMFRHKLHQLKLNENFIYSSKVSPLINGEFLEL